MSDFSLRLPYLIYLSIGSILFGVLIAPVFRDVPEPAATEMADMAMSSEMDHGTRDVPASGAPSITMTVQKDPMYGWNITLEPVNFTFAPEQVNRQAEANTGHAHLYVDGTKMARLYAQHFHMPDLPPGQHEVVVALSANDHAYYTVGGTRIEARAVIMQEAGTM